MVALVFLAEAHVAVTVALCHAGMVDHEKVDVKVVSACPLDLIVLCNHKEDALSWHFLVYLIPVL